jgi:tetratricopeptide (TPR) repeat protein
MSDSDKPKKDEDKTLIDADGEMVNSLMDEMSGDESSTEDAASAAPVPPPIPTDDLLDELDEEDEATRAMEAPSFEDEDDDEDDDEEEEEDEDGVDELSTADENTEEEAPADDSSGDMDFESDPGAATVIAHAATEADMEMEAEEEEEEAPELDDGGEKTMMLDLNAGAAAIPRARFRVVFGNDRGETFDFSPGTYTVGRHESADLALNDPAVSRRHFNIVVSDTTSRVLDLGSGNGTKVDGTLATDAQLSHGMQIEVGTSVLRYEDPMRPEDEFSSDDLPTSRPQPSAPAAAPAPAPARPAPAVPRFQAPPPKEGGLGWLIALLLVVFMGGAFVAGEAVFGWYNVLGIGPDKGASVSGGGSAETADNKKLEKARDLFTKAQTAFDEYDWLTSLDFAERAFTLDPSMAKAKDLMDRSKNERKAKKTVDLATQMGSELDDQIRKKLEAIPTNSSYHIPAKKLLEAAQVPEEKLIVAAIVEAISVRDVEGAEAQLDLLNTHHPRSIKYLEFKRKIDKLKKRLASSRRVTSSRPRNPRPRPEPRPRTTSGADLSQGYSLYAQGSYDRAARFFEDISERSSVDGATRQKAKKAAKAVSKYESNFGSGKQALARYDAQRAIQLLSLARKADRVLGSKNRNEVHPLLARAYLMGAKDLLQNRQYARAMQWVRKALALDPGNSDAQELYRKLEPKAKTLFNEALQARDSGDTTRAKRLLQDVIGMVPEGSSTYIKARNALNAL